MEINGMALADKIREQAVANGARMINVEVVAVDFSKRPLVITLRTLDGKNKTSQIKAQSCIIAMGTKPKFLGIPGEKEFWGKGVTNCAICDGSLYKDLVVGVVGGGDAAVIEALYLSNIAKEVNIFVRGDKLRAIEERRVKSLQEIPNVKFFFNTTVEEVLGSEDQVVGVRVKEKGETRDFQLDGLFLAIGSTPNSQIFQKSLKLDGKGYIVLKKDQETSMEGIYAVGDIVDPVYKQAISAAGDGAKAALQAQGYITDKMGPIAKTTLKVQKVPISYEVVEVKSIKQFEDEFANSEIPIVVDFYATWCGPCKRISPVLESSANTLAGKVRFLKVNVDHFAELSNAYGVQAMPTAVLFDALGEELNRKVGFDPIAALLRELEETQ